MPQVTEVTIVPPVGRPFTITVKAPADTIQVQRYKTYYAKEHPTFAVNIREVHIPDEVTRFRPDTEALEADALA